MIANGLNLLHWLSEQERAALQVQPAKVQRALIEAAQDICSGAPDAPGYRGAASKHGVKNHRRLLAAIAGPVRKLEQEANWNAVLMGIPGGEGRAHPRTHTQTPARVPARAREEAMGELVEMPQGTPENAEDLRYVPECIWPNDWPAQRARAADYFLVGCNIAEVARSVGVSRPTASRWWNHDQEFRDAIIAQRRVMNQHRMAKAYRLGDLILDRLIAAVPEMTPQELIKAAPAILDRVGLVKTERVEMTSSVVEATPDLESARQRLEAMTAEAEERVAKLRKLRELRARLEGEETA